MAPGRGSIYCARSSSGIFEPNPPSEVDDANPPLPSTDFVEPHPSTREQDGSHGTMGEGVTVDAAGNIFVGEVSLSGMTMFMPHGTMMSH